MTKMKKIVLWLLVVQCVCFSLILSATAATSGETNLSFTTEASASVIAAGETFTVTVSIDKNDGFYDAKTALIYDPTLVTYVSHDVSKSAFAADDLVVAPRYADDAKTQETGRITVTIGDPSSILPFQNPAQAQKFYKVNANSADQVMVVTFRLLDSVKTNTDITFATETLVKAVKGIGANLVPSDQFVMGEGTTTVQFRTEAVHEHELTEATWNAGKAATCTEDGVLPHYFCVGCQKAFDKDKKEMASTVDKSNGHAYGEWIAEVPATCKATGTAGHYTCSVCSKNFDADKKELASLELPVSDKHTEVVLEAKAPTCGATGLTEGKKCSVCDKVLVAQTEVAKGGEHVYRDSDWKTVKNATQDEEGLRERKCRICGALQSEPIAKMEKTTSVGMIILIVVICLVVAGGIAVGIVFIVIGASKKKATAAAVAAETTADAPAEAANEPAAEETASEETPSEEATNDDTVN